MILRLAELPVIGRKILSFFVNKQGDEISSSLLREYYRKKNVEVGLYSYGGCFSNSFNNGGYVKVGRYCSIAEHVSFFGANHPTNYLSQSALFYNKTFGFPVKDVARASLSIGNDVWLGYGVVITSGCTRIGNGAVVGAGSIVTHDVPPYAIVAGNPAKIIRMRFDADTIAKIESSKWWEKKPEEIMKYYDSISDPLTMITLMGENNGKEYA